MRIETGECIYCGQMHQFEVEEGLYLTEEQKSRKATEMCDCKESKAVQESVAVKTRTQENISTLFHEHYPEAEKILLDSIEYLQDGNIDEVVVKSGGMKAQMNITSKGKIKVGRERKMKTTLENQ